MKIYTKTGDEGNTSLYGAGRVAKSHPRVEAYGNIDETLSAIGVYASCLSAASAEKEIKEQVQALLKIQNRLFDVGAELATPKADKQETLPYRVNEKDIEFLEQEIDRMEASLKPLQNFILPGGHTCAAHAHLARSICRRAERSMIAYERASSGEAPFRPVLVAYMNRLSDYLFVSARYTNAFFKIEEPEWESPN